ncbi:MAG: peptide chain release factor N(5)-glutamine methyltransferase [Ginsengibacter sp.]
MTTEQFYNHFLNELKTIYEEREAINISDWVFEEVTHFKKWERRRSLIEINQAHVSQLELYLDEFIQHKPVQYVLGHTWFYKRKFLVDENVLIPRPGTEELVRYIVDDVKKLHPSELQKTPGILDIGSGSGCIAISIKKELQKFDVTATDVSERALFVAKKNGEELKADIQYLHADFLDETKWNLFGTYDILVSNPPYIPQKEKAILSKNVTDFEPGIALFVPDIDPFIFYKKIAKFASLHLKPSGKIYVEIHENFANEVVQIFTTFNFDSEVKKDIYGKERMIKAY